MELLAEERRAGQGQEQETPKMDVGQQSDNYVRPGTHMVSDLVVQQKGIPHADTRYRL